MERYAPTIKDLAPRDMVSRAIYQEIKEGRGAGPNSDWAYLDITHLDPKVIEEKLPDITEFARVYLKVEPTKEPVPIQPTAHYAMGGIPTDTDGRVVIGPERDARPRPVRRGRVRLRQRPRGEPPGDQLAAGPRRVRPPRPAPMPPATRRKPICAALPEAPVRGTLGLLNGFLERETGDNAADIRKELQDSMFDLAFVVRSEEGLAKMEEILAGLRERYDAGRHHRQGQHLQHRPDGNRRAGVPARLRRDPRASAPGHAPRAAAATTARTTRSATTPTGSSTPSRTATTTVRSGSTSSP